MSFGQNEDLHAGNSVILKQGTKEIADASTFQIDFKGRKVIVRGQLFLSVFDDPDPDKPKYKFEIDKLNDDVTNLVTQYIRDNMAKYAKEVDG